MLMEQVIRKSSNPKMEIIKIVASERMFQNMERMQSRKSKQSRLMNHVPALVLNLIFRQGLRISISTQNHSLAADFKSLMLSAL